MLQSFLKTARTLGSPGRLAVALTALLGLGLLAGPAAHAQFAGSEQVINSGAGEMNAVHGVDFDGDGDNDVLTGTVGTGAEVAWYDNQLSAGSGFGAKQTITTNVQPVGTVQAADLDGDGDKDALSASSGSGTIAWYENKLSAGSGFGAKQAITSNLSFGGKTVLPADLDGDGDKEVLYTSKADSLLAWRETNGDGTFGSRQAITSSLEGAESIDAADINGDGDKDIIVGTGRDGADEISWYENQLSEGGGFGAKQTITMDDVNGVAVVSGVDVDGDGDKDILASSVAGAAAGQNRILWYENQVGESGADSDGFGSKQKIETYAPQALKAMDVDGDGDPDALAGYGDRISWYENQVGESGADSDGFGAEQQFTTNVSRVESVDAVEIDGDGDKDALIPSFYDGKVAWYENTHPKVSSVSLGNDGSGNLALSFDSNEQLSSIAVTVDGPTSGTDIYSFAGTDFAETNNGDGTYTYDLSTTQAYGDGTGTYTAAVDDAVDADGNDGAGGTGTQTDIYQLPYGSGSALTLDGTDDYIKLSNESRFDFTGDFTVSFWMKVDSDGWNDDFESLVTKGETSWRVQRDGSNSGLGFDTNHGGSITGLRGSVSVEDNEWHHVVAVYDQSAGKKNASTLTVFWTPRSVRVATWTPTLTRYALEAMPAPQAASSEARSTRCASGTRY